MACQNALQCKELKLTFSSTHRTRAHWLLTSLMLEAQRQLPRHVSGPSAGLESALPGAFDVRCGHDPLPVPPCPALSHVGCQGAVFEKKAQFDKAVFGFEAYEKVIVTESADKIITWVKTPEVIFDDAKFLAEVSFLGVQFNAGAQFRGTDFVSEAHFEVLEDGDKIKRIEDIEHFRTERKNLTKRKASVNLSPGRTEAPTKITKIKTDFKGKANFARASFKGVTHFSVSTFCFWTPAPALLTPPARCRRPFCTRSDSPALSLSLSLSFASLCVCLLHDARSIVALNPKPDLSCK